MRKTVIAICVVLTAALTGIAPVMAATISANGTGSYEKLVVNNGNKNLVFKVHAPGPGCDGAKYVAVKFRDRDGTRYEMDGGCYPGNVWQKSLVRGEKIVDCSGFRLKYNADNSVWTGKIPRTCLKRLGGALKVTQSWVVDYTPNANEVAGTKYVAQG